ncbi:MAG: phosphomannomutase/phosphoglucomutase [Planctomycetota bacterium]
MSIYKACDIRGVYPDQLDPPLAESIGRAVGSERVGTDAVAGGSACAVAGDGRNSTPALKEAFIRGLLGAGANVVDLGPTPTPVAYWAARHLDIGAAAIITASHNPPEYNGLKFMLGRTPVTPEDVQRVKRRVEERDFASGAGHRTGRDVRATYLDWLRNLFGGSGGGRKVVVDAGNGMASDWAPQAFRDAGYAVEELFCTVDGDFPNRSPNPSKPKALEPAGRRVREVGAQFAACFDGDADRVVFLDENGEIVPPEEGLILLARDVLRHRPGPVVYDQKCPDVVPEEIEKHGGTPLMERSGHAFIKRRLLEEDAVMAGEASGHYFFRELGGDDGIYAALRMGQLLGREGSSPSELRAAIPEYFISRDIRIQRPRGDARQVVERLKEAFSDRPQDYTDGVRIRFEDGWALVRASVTEPAVTVRVEGDSPESMRRLRELVTEAIPE